MLCLSKRKPNAKLAYPSESNVRDKMGMDLSTETQRCTSRYVQAHREKHTKVSTHKHTKNT
jgi:hypothetical protein